MRGWTGRTKGWAGRARGGAERTPRRVVALVMLYVAVLVLVGTASHLADLLRDGLRSYEWAPDWLNLYWSSLAVLDSAAALLLLRGRRAGVDLMCAVMVTDTAANWYAVYGIQHVDVSARPGLWRLAVFTLFVLATGPFVRARLRPRHGVGRGHDGQSRPGAP
ncbi:hypothetical protein [Streptomyces sp. NBC_00893]|uniref:hypothetical protein n=1 Tax=Streptomyces sp. NBC_00893 TaxID=2975862 RepID=UPI00225A8CE9|nr:hypothetical protein [Streptomyces sp. NBC_00893]MCX4849742.1 hypothetical protein [Streptomyces sp. NBC_00893]